jgi:hypothetical protein
VGSFNSPSSPPHKPLEKPALKRFYFVVVATKLQGESKTESKQSRYVRHSFLVKDTVTPFDDILFSILFFRLHLRVQGGVRSSSRFSHSQGKHTMKFLVIYRLTHPQYMPAISHTTVSAQTHQQLDRAISKLVKKWEEQGYTLRILAVRKRLSVPQ